MVTKVEHDDGKSGMYFTLPDEIQKCLIVLTRKLASETWQENKQALNNQRDAKKKKESIAAETASHLYHAKHQEALHFHKLYDSNLCWKTPEAVDKG